MGRKRSVFLIKMLSILNLLAIAILWFRRNVADEDCKVVVCQVKTFIFGDRYINPRNFLRLPEFLREKSKNFKSKNFNNTLGTLASDYVHQITKLQFGSG